MPSSSGWRLRILSALPGCRPRDTREWVHEERSHVQSWGAPRRVIVVFQEQPDDLFFHDF